MSLRTGAHAGAAIRNTPTPHLLPHGGNGFPRRCAPRNDIFHGDHLALRRGGAERRPYAHFISFSVGRHPCVPPPTCTAPPTAGHAGPALQIFYQLRTLCPAPVGRGALTPPSIRTTFPKNLSLRTSVQTGVEIRPPFYPSFSPFPTKNKKIFMQKVKLQKPLAKKDTQC